MRHHHEGGSLAVDVLEKYEHLLLALRVEIARGLVEQQHARAHHEGASDRHTLLLAAGQLRREVIGPIGEAHFREAGEHPFAALSSRHLGVDERQLDVAVSGRARQQVVGLEHESDVLAADVRPARLVERGHLLADQPLGA